MGTGKTDHGDIWFLENQPASAGFVILAWGFSPTCSWVR